MVRDIFELRFSVLNALQYINLYHLKDDIVSWCLAYNTKFTEQIEQKVCTTLADITRRTYCGVYRFDLLHRLKMASVFVTFLEILRSKTIEYSLAWNPKVKQN